MNTNVTISLDTRRAKKDGTYPIIMRIGHNERTTSVNLGISVLEKDWDNEKRLVKKSYVGLSSVTRLNNFIHKAKSNAMDEIIKLNEQGVLSGMSVISLKEKLTKKDKSESFYSYAEGVVKSLYDANRVGTARSYAGVIAILKSFHKGDLAFQQINFSFLSKLEERHRANGHTLNGLAVYMRSIRSIYNKAIKDGVTSKEYYPFDDYKIKTTPTEKRALDIALLKRIIDLDLPSSHPLFHTRNYFLASYMMYGMNYTDMAYLKKSNIKNNRIQYRRRKTSKLYDIKIVDSLKAILDYYQSDSEYIFPIIKRGTAILQDKDIQGARKRYNKKLKKLADLCDIEQNLTSYVSRHSFATQAMVMKVPLNAISTMLGHSSLKTTEVYLKSLPTNALDEYNETILKL